MDIHITQPDLEARLTQSAAQQGRHPDELAQDVLAQYFDEETRYRAALKRGDASLRRGEYLTHEEVGERLKRPPQSPAPSAEPKNLVELFAPLRGQFTDEEVDTLFSRNRSTARPLDLT
jgi:predicted transcriptional regulator